MKLYGKENLLRNKDIYSYIKIKKIKVQIVVLQIATKYVTLLCISLQNGGGAFA